jgi:hypothetical protein
MFSLYISLVVVGPILSLVFLYLALVYLYSYAKIKATGTGMENKLHYAHTLAKNALSLLHIPAGVMVVFGALAAILSSSLLAAVLYFAFFILTGYICIYLLFLAVALFERKVEVVEGVENLTAHRRTFYVFIFLSMFFSVLAPTLLVLSLLAGSGSFF